MPRNRIIYQSEALYAGPSPATGFHFVDNDLAGGTHSGPWANGHLTTGFSLVHQLQRIQDASYSFNITRQDVNQFGELAAIDRVILESPTVSLDFSYIMSNMINEHLLGFHVQHSGQTDGHHSALSGVLDKTSDERNYFIKTVAEGQDAYGDATIGNNPATNVIGIGNAFMTSYTAEAAVGDFPTASLSVEGLNMDFVPNTSGNHVPAIYPSDGSKVTTVKYVLPSGMSHATTGRFIVDKLSTDNGTFEHDKWHKNEVSNASLYTSALRPGDISVSFWPKGGIDGSNEISAFTGVTISDAKIQSYSLSFDLAREPLAKLGNKFAFAREITFPVTVSLTVDANLGDLTTGNLADVIDVDSSYDVALKLGRPGLGATHTAAAYFLKNCKIDSQEYTSDIGTNKAVSLTLSSQIGGPAQTDKGLFMSGIWGAHKE